MKREPGESDQIKQLLRVGRTLMSEHDTEHVLARILDNAREITGARYAALGVLDQDRKRLGRFLTLGIEPHRRDAIGDLPRGRGVLGVLIEAPRPLRLADVSEHPESYGFPIGHPQMRSFLGVPIVIRGEAWGNLYLAEKEGQAEFSEEDEAAVVALGQFAATAISNARLFEESEQRRTQLERAVRSLEAARDIADAISGASDLTRVLELIAKRGRALVDARSVLIMLRERNELVVAATAGRAAAARGRRLPMSTSSAGSTLTTGRPQRVSDAANTLRVSPTQLGIGTAHAALLVPMLSRGNQLGVLAAFDRTSAGQEFTHEDEQLLRTFAASAAHAVAVNQSVEAERLRSTIAAADAERSRWARELHDQTLQSLGALRVALASIVGRGDSGTKDEAIRQAIEDIELEIANLRGIITDLRPSMLDDLGLVPAVEALLDRRRDGGLQIDSRIALDDAPELNTELETTVYRLVQEALTNVVKHARATTVRVNIGGTRQELTIEVQDDGVGLDPNAKSSGFGLAGMRERVYLASGTLTFEPVQTGTFLRARIPLQEASWRAGSGTDQVMS